MSDVAEREHGNRRWPRWYPASFRPEQEAESLGAPGSPTGHPARNSPHTEKPQTLVMGLGSFRCVLGHHSSGGGGNRTRVLRYITRASPGAACCVFLSPGSHAGKLPTGSVAV